jgi:hypothetical protein
VFTMTRSIGSHVFFLLICSESSFSFLFLGVKYSLNLLSAIWTICVGDVSVWPGQAQDRAQHQYFLTQNENNLSRRRKKEANVPRSQGHSKRKTEYVHVLRKKTTKLTTGTPPPPKENLICNCTYDGCKREQSETQCTHFT